VAKGTNLSPTTLLEAYNLVQKWKVTRPRSMETSKPLAVYVAQNQAGRKSKAGRFGGGNGAGENAGPGNGGRQNTQGQNAKPGNFSLEFRGKCYICDRVGHRKCDCSQAINIKNPRNDDANQIAVAKKNRVRFEDEGWHATFVIRNVTLSNEETRAHLKAGAAPSEGASRKVKSFAIGSSETIQELYTSVHSAINHGLEWKDTFVVLDTAAESSRCYWIALRVVRSHLGIKGLGQEC
jgi:hypothetical protein